MALSLCLIQSCLPLEDFTEKILKFGHSSERVPKYCVVLTRSVRPFFSTLIEATLVLLVSNECDANFAHASLVRASPNV